MTRFHLKLLIGLLAFFGLFIAGMYLYQPFMLKWYERKLASDDPADKVAGVDGFIGMGKAGKARFREVFADGPEAAELLFDHWADVNEEDGHDQTPLHYAVNKGYICVPRLNAADILATGYRKTR